MFARITFLTTRANKMIFSTPEKISLGTPIKPRGRGRPPTHPVDRLRTRLWFHVVKLRSGLPSAYAIEMAIDGDHVRKRATDVSRPQRWDQYRRGEKVPNDKPGPRNAVEQAESNFQGTAQWFRSPIWPILRGDKCDRYVIEGALRQLQPEVVKILFEAAPREYESLPWQKAFDEESKEKLVALGGFDALVAAVLLVGLSEDISSPKLRESALSLYIELQAGLKEQPELTPFYQELFSWVDNTCKHWVYLSPNQRMDMVIFWQGVQADVEKRAANRENVDLGDDENAGPPPED